MIKLIEQGEILTLNDDKKYVVVKTTVVREKQYVFLINQDDYTDTKICEYDGNKGLNDIEDEEILERLVQIFNS